MTQPARPTTDYRLPDGTIVAVYEDAARGASVISYTLKGGRVVPAVRVAAHLQTHQQYQCWNCDEPVTRGRPHACDRS